METVVEASLSGIFKRIGVGGVVEAVGVIVFCVGAAQLFHHGAIAACVLGGAAAFLAGKRIRASA